MRNPHLSHADRNKLALEMTMRDALDGLEELASLDVYWFASDCLEILGIEPPVSEPVAITSLRHTTVPAKILTFPEKRLRTG